MGSYVGFPHRWKTIHKTESRKNKIRTLRNRDSNYTITSNPVKKKGKRSLKQTSLATGISQVRSSLKITHTKDRRREVNSEQIQEWSEFIQIGSGSSDQV